MRVRFNIHFHTSFGQQLFIVGSIPELGCWNTTQAKEMLYISNGMWHFELNIPNEVLLLHYHYFLKCEKDKLIFEERKYSHYVLLDNYYKNYYILDFWQLKLKYKIFYSSAFVKNWFARNNEYNIIPIYKRTVRFKISAPLIIPNERVALLGNNETLGNWNPSKSLPLSCEKFPDWQIDLDAEKLPKMFEYKFCIINEESKILHWEEGENRYINIPSLEKDETLIVSSLQFRNKKPEWKCAGLAIPIFSLKTNNSFGIGDFGDLLQIIDWVKITKQKIIQILPVNDTTIRHTWKDSYPYNIISVFALHPLYLNLGAIGILKSPKRDIFYKSKQKELNKSFVVNYEEVDKWKWKFFHEIFQQEGEKVLSSSEFIAFFKKNQEWLIPYANYSYLRDRHCTTFLREEKYVSNYDSQPFQYKLYYYLQFHAHKQLKKASIYARQNRIVLKGDLPIGIHREGVETWIKPDYFNMHFQAGAPPDSFSTTGQAWGFPIYNWESMKSDNYRWWKQRLQKMANYFDAYRIDHIFGFFRAWQIPKDSDARLGYFSPTLPLCIEEIERWGLRFDEKNKELFIEDKDKKGYYHPLVSAHFTANYKELSPNHQAIFDRLYNNYFYKRHNKFWKSIALKRLTPLVDSTNMLVCSEDLGMIPPHSVPEVLNILQILSLEIERMPKSPREEFTNLNRVPYLSICTTSTHDTNPIRAWWKEDKKQTKKYYKQILKKEGVAPKNCTTEISKTILRNHLKANSILVIIPLQDWISIDAKLRNPYPEMERINNPTNSCHYWRYRMHLTIEDLLKAKKLNAKICDLIQQSNRIQF